MDIIVFINIYEIEYILYIYILYYYIINIYYSVEDNDSKIIDRIIQRSYNTEI